MFSVSNTIKDREVIKEYKRKVSMKDIKLIDIMKEIIFVAENE